MEPLHQEIHFDEDSYLEEEKYDSLQIEEEKYQASIKRYQDCTDGVVSQMELDRLNEERKEAERSANRNDAGKNSSKTGLEKTEDPTFDSTLNQIRSKKHKLKKLFHQLTKEVKLEIENEGRNLKRTDEESTVANADKQRLLGDSQDECSEQHTIHYQNLESECQDLIEIEGNDQNLNGENTPLSIDKLSFEKRSLYETFYHQPCQSSDDEIPLDDCPSNVSSNLVMEGVKGKMAHFEKSIPRDEKFSIAPSLNRSSKSNFDGVKDKLVRFENRSCSEEKISVQRSPSKVSFNLALEGIKDKLERFEKPRPDNNSPEHRPTRVSSKPRLEGIKDKFVHLENSSHSREETSMERKLRLDGVKEKLVQFENGNLGKDENKDSISVESESSFKSCHEGVLDDVELKSDKMVDDNVDDCKNGKTYESVDNDMTCGNALAVTAEEKKYLSHIGKLSEDVPVCPAVCTVPSRNFPRDELVLPVGMLSKQIPIQRNVSTASGDNVVYGNEQMFSKTCKEVFDNEELAITSHEQSLCDLTHDVAQIMSGLEFHTKQKQEVKMKKLRELHDPEMVIAGKLPLEFTYISEHRLDECRDDMERATTADEKIAKLRELKVESFLKGVLDVERLFHKELVSLNCLATKLETLNEVTAEWKKNPDGIFNYNKLSSEMSCTALCKLRAIGKTGNSTDSNVKSNAKGDSMEDVKDSEISTKSLDSSFKFKVMAGDSK